jgi:hypothetical protein
VVPNWKTRVASRLEVEVREGMGEDEAAVTRLLVVGWLPGTALRASAS